MKEFNLSEERKKIWKKIHKNCFRYSIDNWTAQILLDLVEQQDREFIQKLKDSLCIDIYEGIGKQIDKLAGKELSK